MVGTRSRGQAYDASVGEELRAARRRLRLSLDEVALNIRIPPSQLRSLEEGNLSAFAAEVYARGAYLKYARYVGVDGERGQRAFLRSLSGVRERVPLHLPQTASWFKRVTMPIGAIVLGVVGCLLLVAGYLAWQVQSFVRVPALTVTEPAALVTEQLEVTVRGTTEREARLTVNGEAVLLGADGSFHFELPLHPGLNVVQVEATGASGRTSLVQRRLLVSRS
ncbi:MAG TPA: helix-turn-helix domain-containing protein [Candidatus Andersenbacteria bacterium]|nr:helix-turn-helix domain-containing protein [Candidatus Andersenbacteria bacterium]